MNTMYMIAAATIKQAVEVGKMSMEIDSGNKIDHGENRNYNNNNTEYYVSCASLSSWYVVTCLIILTQ